MTNDEDSPTDVYGFSKPEWRGPAITDPVIAFDAEKGQHCIGIDGEQDNYDPDDPDNPYNNTTGKDAWEILTPHGSSFEVTFIEPETATTRPVIHVKMAK